MRFLRMIGRRLSSVFDRARKEEELEREVSLHLEQLVREFQAEGLTREDAVRAARKSFGPVERIKEECRDERGVNVIEDLRRDAAFALRMLRKSPGFTLTALISLTLGIGANTAMFQMFDAVRLKSLPVARPDELLAIHAKGERSGNFRGRNGEFSYALWDEIRRQQKSFAGMLAYGDMPINLSPGGEIRNAEGLRVSGTFFDLLGIQAQLGRVFHDSDDRPGCGWEAAVISDAFWQREFARAPDVLTRSLTLDGHRVPVVGVTPAGFLGVEVGRSFDVAIPICALSSGELANRTFNFLSIVGRLRPEASEATARHELKAMSQAVFAATVPSTYQPDAQARYRELLLDGTPAAAGQSEFREEFSQPLAYLLAMVALVLLLACANLANMMLARATSREHEFAVRRSMGATRWRLIQQVLVESLILSSVGALVGSLAAPAIGRALVAMMSTPRDPIVVAFDASPRVLLFAALAATLATLAFGLVPALRAARAATRGASEGRATLAFRRLLLGAQVALSMVLLTAALLFSRSFQNLQSFSPGFDPDGILVASIFLDGERYAPDSRPAVIDSLFGRIRSAPGVLGAARSSIIPMSGSSSGNDARVEGSTVSVSVRLSNVSPGYLPLMRMPILSGRDFDANDRADAPMVAIVNETFRRRLLDGRDPVGRTFQLTGSERVTPPILIVGVTRDSKYGSLSEAYEPIAYLADQQMKVRDPRLRIVMRAAGDPSSLIGTVRSLVAEADPRLSLRFTILREQLNDSVLRERLMAALTGAFGLLGMILALTGVFGVTSYVVSRRNREFGIRIAMGATAGDIVRMILHELFMVVMTGIAVGAVAAIVAGASASSLLYGVKAYDPATLLAVTALLGFGGLLAGLVPARRASLVRPVDVLRPE